MEPDLVTFTKHVDELQVGVAEFFDIILHPAFSVFVLITFVVAVAALVIACKQKQLSSGLKGILVAVLVLCALYLGFFVSLVFLFNSVPPALPVPTAL